MSTLSALRPFTVDDTTGVHALLLPFDLSAANSHCEPILPNFGVAAKVCFGTFGSLLVLGSRTRNSDENSSIEVMI
jgi:hypothetical protein